MLQKFNITAYAVVLCLFGFMLFSAAPVFANYDYGYGDMDVACKAIKDGSSTDDQIDECFTDIWDRASLSTYDSLMDEHNSEIQQLKDEHAEAADEYKSEIQQLKDKKDELAEAADEHESEIQQLKDEWAEINKTLISQNETFENNLAEICEILNDYNEEARMYEGREVIGWAVLCN